MAIGGPSLTLRVFLASPWAIAPAAVRRATAIPAARQLPVGIAEEAGGDRGRGLCGAARQHGDRGGAAARHGRPRLRPGRPTRRCRSPARLATCLARPTAFWASATLRGHGMTTTRHAVTSDRHWRCMKACTALTTSPWRMSAWHASPAGPSAPIVQAQIAIPAPFDVPIPGEIPLPSEIVPPLVTPNISPLYIPKNPYPSRPECVREWADAYRYCQKLSDRGLLRVGDYRGMGKTLSDCIMGQVSESCGGNATSA